VTLPDVLPAGAVDLRRWRAEWAEAVVAALAVSIDELRPWMPWAQEVPSLDEERKVLADGDAAFARGDAYGFVVVEHDGRTGGDEVVGGCGLHPRVAPDAIEIGYWIRTDRWGRGYASAAAAALTDAAFAHLEVARVEIQMDRANVRSAAVPRRLGYRLVREEEREPFAPGHTGVTLVWEVGRDEWGSARRP
jgi:RimJ/RimL family protein N-acetyltransferase